jgi:transposase
MKEQEFYEAVLDIIKPWEVEKVEIDKSKRESHVYLKYPEKVAGKCPECGKESKIHDKREERVWRDTDSCHYKTFIHCKMPRSDCEEHGVRTMEVPWSTKLSRFTKYFEMQIIYLLLVSKNQSKTAEYFDLSWDEINGIMRRSVERGLSRREEEGIKHLGMDEKSFLSGQSYATILTDTDGKRVLDVVEGRDENAVNKAYEGLSEAQLAGVEAISMDFWKAFINGAETKMPQADIVHDKFHIMKYMSEAVDTVRRAEHKENKKVKDETLTGTKYLFLKNPTNLTDKEKARFAELNINQLDVGRAWNRLELLREFWMSESEDDARQFFKDWYFSATHSRLEPVIKVAKMFKRHIEYIITYWKHKISNSFAEGINSVIQHIKSTARGFRNFANYRTAILFHCGKLNLYP